MTILITADLHLDDWDDAERDPFAGILPVLRALDALIIAGDLANNPQRNWPTMLKRIARLVSPARIWVVSGNHDYYGATLDDAALAQIVADAGAHLAQKRVLTFGCCAARSGRILPCSAIRRQRWTARLWPCRITAGSAGSMGISSRPRTPPRSIVITSTG